MGRASPFKEVTPVGLMRTPPPGGHFKKPSLSGTPSVLSSPPFTRRATVPDSPSSFLKSEPLPAQSIPEPEPPMPKAVKEEEPKTLEPEVGEEEEEEEEEEELKPSTVPEDSPVDSPEKPLVEEPQNSPKPESIRKPPALSTRPNFSLPNREPLSPKPKPQSPVVDFRANLRKRDVAQDKEKQAEPEFKNVFGKLKKTETRNYVAPDELKDNILRGKSALNNTGGPKKTPRVDEFRQSLVITKEAMKAGGGSIRRNTAGEQDAPAKPAEPIPEALAKRNLMTKTNNDRKTNPDIQSPTTVPELSPTRSFRAPEAPVSPLALEKVASPVASKHEFADMEPKFSPSLDLDRNDVVETEKELPNEEIRSVRSLRSSVSSETASMPTTQVSAAKGKLAGRINPALAGLLSRGPPIPAEGHKKELSVPASGDASPASPSAPLTHATKGRARGPKRRAPQGDSAPAVSPVEDIKEVGAILSPEVETSQTIPEPVASPEANSDNTSTDNVVVDTETAQIGSPYLKQFPGVKTTFQDVLNGGLQRLRSFSPTSPRESTVLSPIEHAPRESESSRDASPSSRPPVPPKPSSPSPSPSPSSPSSRFQWGQARFISPSPSPLRMSSRELQKDLPSTPSPKSVPGVTVADSSPQSTSGASPPVPRKRPDVSLARPIDPRNRLSRKMSAPSLVAQAAEAREVIGEFFKTFPNPRDRMDIDPQLVLAGKLDDTKIRTVKRQIWEMTGDGKKQELPVNQEYVLYEGSMYVCVHLFEADGSNHAEVYLWCGDDVSEAALDDAQLFARKVARENSCKLQVIRQGKERLRFIQALGGIIITRRGSSSRSTSSSLYMLCGRKHLGQMAFDEVDYSLRNLCSGFPFVISAPFGKLYLWKGKGSGPEETGAARLISMDLGLTGEFEEVTEGEEPESFFDDFAGSNEANALLTSDYWQLKPKFDHYRTRLLRIDHELGQPPRFWMRRPGSGTPTVRPNDTVQEIEPFCYRDLTDKDVYVLDTFFEIYVIIGEQASQKSADFTSAVVFAHEYGILAASLQDRPFIPKSFVALGGIPDRCQSAFRKWEVDSLHAPCVFPLDVAIEAIRSPAE